MVLLAPGLAGLSVLHSGQMLSEVERLGLRGLASPDPKPWLVHDLVL